MNAEDLTRRLDEMRQRVEGMREEAASPGQPFEELLQMIEELRSRNGELAGAHLEIEHERRRYQQLFHFAPDAYLLTDLAGIVREANRSAAELLKVSPRALPGKTVVSFVAAEDRAKIRAELSRWQSEPAAKSLEIRLQPRRGEPFEAAITLSVARGGRHDTAVGFRWLVRDISAHHRLTQELREREEATRREAEAIEAGARHVQKLESIGVLAGGIAHDFNNLLHVVLGNADLARLHLPPDADAREYLDEVVRATQQAADLTQQLLAYSGRGAVEIRRLDLSNEVREFATLLRTAISKQATLVWDLGTGLPPITADPTQLRQVLMNLITNASDALGGSPGTITLRTGMASEPSEGQEPEPAVFLEVTDTGCGMDSGTLERIFDPFFSTKFAGRGLGLAAVMGIVDRHHGRIRIRTAPGEGTTFRLLFPASPGTADAAPRRVPGAKWHAAGRVLVVEDEEGVREVVGRMLARIGFQVVTAEDGLAALERLEAHEGELAVVLLDLSMPRMDGHELLRHIRAQYPELPVVLMSGYSEQEVASTLSDDSGGSVSFLQKPFLPEDLTSVLRRVVQPIPR